MPNFCLLPQAVDAFKAKLIDGTINPAKLTKMTSKERHDFFKEIVGEENAKGVNSLFESKMLLKNQQRGMITWAKTVAGMKPAVRRDLISRIQKMDRVLDPTEHEQFLNDLASTKLGVDVTQAEAKKIIDLAKRVTDTEGHKDRLVHGRAKVALTNYVDQLKEEANKQSVVEHLKDPLTLPVKVGGVAKSVKASLDNSAIFRQGWKTLWTHPGVWQKNARKTFGDIKDELQAKSVMDEVNADILSRPNYDKYRKAGLAVSTIEEAYPSHLPGKLPVLGRAFKASESAFTGFVYRQRADVFDKYLEMAKNSGVNIDDPKQLKAIGKLVNSLTGRGNLGGLERSADVVNNIFFSPRFLKSNIDTLTAHRLTKGTTEFTRKQAAENLVKIITGTAGVLAVAYMIDPKSVNFDPRSSDFGKIKVGHTRFDVTGGMGAIVTLASRLMPTSGPKGTGQYTKSTTTGALKKLNSGFGSQTGLGVLGDFLENKLSPAGAVVADLIKNEDFHGNKPTIAGEAKNLVAPLPITTYEELQKDPDSANTLVGMLADVFGISTNTYGKSTTNWNKNPGVELQQFKDKVGPEKFNQANKDYNLKVDQWMRDNKDYIMDLPIDQREEGIKRGKDEAKKSIFRQYNFKYEEPQDVKEARKQKARETRLKNKLNQ